MIKLRQMKGRLGSLTKTILSSALLLLFVVACEDDESGQNSIGEVLYIDGPAGVTPESTVTYTASEAGGTVSWTVTGNATLGATDGLTADVTFGAVGTATVSASGSGLDGTRAISINGVDAAIVDGGVAMSNSSVNDGGSETVTFTFAAPLASAPTAVLTGDFVAGSISALTAVAGSNNTEYMATVTGGAGNGQLNVAMAGVTVSDDFGGATADLEASIQAVDNIPPHTGSFSSSSGAAKNGSSLVFTVSMNEALRANGDNVVVNVVYDGASGGTDAVVNLTATEDASVWSGSYTVDGDANGIMTATLDASTLVDVAGNSSTAAGELPTVAVVTIDNIAPVPGINTSYDALTKRISVSPFSDTDAESVQWIWLVENSQFVPESVSDFDGEGQGTTAFSVSEGTYKIYYMEVDAAGNQSAIELLEDVEVAE